MTPDVALLRGMLDAAPDALWVLDLDGRTVFANERLARLLGRELDELPGFDALEVADETGRADFETHLELMRAGDPGAENQDVLILRPDGTRIWTLVSWSPLHRPDGSLVGYLHRLTEFTQRRGEAEETQERERLLAEAQIIAHIGSWTWDIPRDEIWWSDELQRIFGYEVGTFGGDYQAFESGLHPDDRDYVNGIVSGALETGADRFEWEGRVQRPNGVVRWARALGVVERNGHGEPLRASGTVQDITELHDASARAEEASRQVRLLQSISETANRSSSVVEALTNAARVLPSTSGWRAVAFWQLDDDGELRPTGLATATEGTHEPSRLAPEPVAARQAWDRGTPVVVDADEVPGHCLVSLPILLEDQPICLLQVDSNRTADSIDEPTMALIVQLAEQISRVAERERAAATLQEARDAAMTASRHKSEFLAMMSHEIRTPMNGVLGLNDLLLATGLDHDQRRLAESLRGSGLSLLALLNDILDLSKVETGFLDLESIEFDLRAVFEQAATVLSGPAYDAGIELVVDWDPSLPRWVVGDPVRLGQILVNLGSNAIKFTDQGEVVVVASVAPGSDLAAPGSVGELRVEVHDTGVGISPDIQAALFQPFTQADVSTTRRHGGTGLGLAISRRLVGLMDGDIGVLSEPGLGSTFWFTVPLTPVTAAPVDIGRPLTGRRMLVVDDNSSAASVLVRLLAGWGADAESCQDAATAVSRLLAARQDDRPVDVLLVDGDLPDLGTVALGARVQGDPLLADTRIVLISPHPASGDSAPTELGFGTRTHKPLIADSVLATVFEALHGRHDLPSLAPPAPESLGRRVLVVEDNHVNQLVAIGLLERLGCTVETADDGQAAVDRLTTGHGFDLVLMDCRMPRLDGFDATRRIRAAEALAGSARVPILAMTASALPGERERCLAAGMDDFLTKPVDAALLEKTVRRWTEHAAGPPGETDEPQAPSDTIDPETSAPQRPVEPAVLDPLRVEMLSELVKDGVSFFDRARMSFLAKIDSVVASLRTAVTDGDTRRVTAIAHQLKGSATNLGLQRVGALAERIELLGAGPTSDPERPDAEPEALDVAALLDRLSAELQVGIDALGEVTAVNPVPAADA